jgi:hypothetical protein
MSAVSFDRILKHKVTDNTTTEEGALVKNKDIISKSRASSGIDTFKIFSGVLHTLSPLYIEVTWLYT